MSAAANTGSIARHDLVRVAPASWPAILARCPPLPDEPLLADWAERDRPLIARRTGRDERRYAGLVPLGVSLPPASKTRRIALQVPAAAICSVSPPPLLAVLVSSAPLAWRATIDQLLELDASARAYGSLVWQHATGLGYLSATSDLDLLWRIAAGSSCEALLAGIAAIERQAPMRIDGEVLVKRLDDVAVLSRHTFMSGGVS